MFKKIFNFLIGTPANAISADEKNIRDIAARTPLSRSQKASIEKNARIARRRDGQ
jgi:hypothetical protein